MEYLTEEIAFFKNSQRARGWITGVVNPGAFRTHSPLILARDSGLICDEAVVRTGAEIMQSAIWARTIDE